MQPLKELDEIYEAWRSLTETEGLAIAAGEWPRVLATQTAKEALRPKIVEAEAKLEAAMAWNRALGTSARQRLGPVTQRLAELERINLRSLEAARSHTRDEQDQMQGTATRLRQVKGAYAGAGASASWQFYS